MMRVGICYDCMKPEKEYGYKDVLYDRDGFANVKHYLPKEYDLCLLKLKDKKKFKMGYHTGMTWDGLKLFTTDEVIGWMRCDVMID